MVVASEATVVLFGVDWDSRDTESFSLWHNLKLIGRAHKEAVRTKSELRTVVPSEFDICVVQCHERSSVELPSGVQAFTKEETGKAMQKESHKKTVREIRRQNAHIEARHVSKNSHPCGFDPPASQVTLPPGSIAHRSKATGATGCAVHPACVGRKSEGPCVVFRGSLCV